MLIHLTPAGEERQSDICFELSEEELLGQLAEECGELVQATQKVIRAWRGRTPVSTGKALANLCEECADVALCIDTLIRAGLVNEDIMQAIGQAKNDRWHSRIVEGHKTDYKGYAAELRKAAEYFHANHQEFPDVAATYRQAADVIEILLTKLEGYNGLQSTD